MSWHSQFEQFCSKLYIDSKEQGTVPLVLNGCQRYFLKEVADGLEKGIRHFVILKGRQLGITTVSLALDLFWAFKHKGLQGSIITDTDSNKEMVREMLSRYWDGLPKMMKAPIKIQNRTHLVFKNRSGIQYMVAGIRAGGNLGRAKALNHLHATECSSWADEEGLASLQSSLAEKSPNRLYIFESTARGFDIFYDMCQTAKRAITQKFIFIGWWLKEDYCYKETEQEYKVYWGSAPHLTGKERQWVAKIKQYYGFEITPGQIAWHRFHLNEKKNGDEMWMTQEYPPTEDEAFVVAGSQFFTAEKLTLGYLRAKKETYDSYRYVTGSEFQFTQIHRTNATNAELKIWEEPRPDGVYVIGADPAYGSSDWADRFAVQVLRCYADRIVQVAEYCTAEISAYQFAWIIAHLAGAYKNSKLNLELTGPGGAVVTELANLQRNMSLIQGTDGSFTDVLGSMKHYFWMRPDSLMKGPGNAIHWRTTQDNKTMIFNSMKDSFEVGRADIKSVELINEMRNIVNDEGTLGASGRAKDDRVFSFALAHWVWAQSERGRLIGERLTYDNAKRRELSGGNMNMQTAQVMNYLKRSRIVV